MAAHIADLIDSLPNSENQLEILENLNTVTGSLQPSLLASAVRNISFNAVFDCLSTNDNEQIEVGCNVLKKLLAVISPNIILNQFHSELLTGVTHPVPNVQKLCLSQVNRVCRESVEDFIQHEEIIQQVITTVADDNLDVANLAGSVIVTLGSNEGGLAVLYQGGMMSSIQDVLSRTETIRFRMYEVLINICKSGVPGLQRTSESGLLQQFLNELHRHDVLLQLNCLELLSDLAVTEHGLTYLDQQGVVENLEVMLQQTQSGPLTGFLVPGLVKFFGCVARVHPKEVCSKSEIFVNAVFDGLSGKDSSTWRLSAETVGLIASSLEGKLALEKLGSRMDRGVQCIGRGLRESQSDLKLTVLQTIASLLQLKVSEQTAELLKLTERWYACLGSGTFDYFMSLTEQPFTELRCGVLAVLQTIAAQPWGQTIMNNHPGFREYLLNRSTEKTKEGKEGKFAVVYTLAHSPTFRDIFGDPYFVQLKVYVEQGPFFVRVQAEVAMEGDS